MRVHANEKPIGSNVPDGPLPCGIWCRALGFTAQDFDLIFGRKRTRPIPDIDEQLPNDFGRSFYVNVVERIDGGMPRVVWVRSDHVVVHFLFFLLEEILKNQWGPGVPSPLDE